MKATLFIIITAIILISCKKKQDLPYCEEFPNECVDVREVKDYFYFKLGSWWVYEEEYSGIRDSVYVTETSSDPESVVFSTRLYSSYDNYYYRFWTTGVRPEVKNNLAKKGSWSTTVYRNKGRPGDYVAEGECLIFHPATGLWTYSYGGAYIGFNNILEIKEIFKEYTLGEKNFQDVVKVTEEHTAIEESQPTVHYYCPNVGLIKKELLDSNQVWHLVNYHIVK